MNHTGASSHLRSQTEIDPFISHLHAPPTLFHYNQGWTGGVLFYEILGEPQSRRRWLRGAELWKTEEADEYFAFYI